MTFPDLADYCASWPWNDIGGCMFAFVLTLFGY